MSSHPLREVEEIFQGALQRDPAERDAYLHDACRGNKELHREVSSLLENHRDDVKGSWAAAASARLLDSPASLQPGQSLGPYRIAMTLIASGAEKSAANSI